MSHSCDLKDCNPLDSSVQGVFLARILECIAISSFRGSYWPRDWTRVSCIGRQVLYHWATRETLLAQDGWVMVESFDKTWSTGEGKENHFSILALRIPWTVSKAQGRHAANICGMNEGCINGDWKRDGGSPRKAEMSRGKDSQKNKGHGEGHYFVSPSESRFPGRLTSYLAQSGSVPLISRHWGSGPKLSFDSIFSTFSGSHSSSASFSIWSPGLREHISGLGVGLLSFVFYCCCSQGFISSKWCFKHLGISRPTCWMKTQLSPDTVINCRWTSCWWRFLNGWTSWQCTHPYSGS